MPQISIVVPVYNVEQYLHRCIDSILVQTFSDFELILVDDGSPDNCGRICDEYAAKDGRIRVIHQKNSGLSAARNAGMELAQGNYILFCDSDDYVSPQWCETLIASAAKKPGKYVFGGIHEVFLGKPNAPAKMLTPENEETEYSVSAFLTLHTKSMVGFAWNVLYDAAIIREHHLRFRKDLVIEDLPFCLEYLKYMHALVYCGHAGYYYVQRDSSSLSRKYYQDGFRKWREKYAMIQEFIEQCIPLKSQELCKKTVADFYLYFFLTSLENTFDKRSTLSFLQKLKYNQEVINSPEFKHCLERCDGSNENSQYLKILKSGNYYIAYLYTFCANVKNTLKRQINRSNGGK